MDDGEELPNINVIRGGIGDYFIQIDITSKYPGQSIASSFYFYGEKLRKI